MSGKFSLTGREIKSGKRFGIAAPMMLIITVMVVGLIILLGSRSGSTPFYYKNMAEQKFGDLYMTYEHTKLDIKNTFEQDTERLFENIGDYPFGWKSEIKVPDETDPDKEIVLYRDWSSAGDLKEEEWSKIYRKKIDDAALKQLSSVENVGFEWIKISIKKSRVDYSEGSTPKLTWTLTYNLDIQNVLSKDTQPNRINSDESLNVDYNFINLNRAKNCAESYFKNLKLEESKFTFGEADEIFVKNGVESEINQVSVDECSGFETSAKIFGEISCGNDICRGDKMKPISFILFIKSKDKNIKGAISFMNEFDNFGYSKIASGFSCSSSSDCSEDCINGFCGVCSSNFEEVKCSPGGKEDSMDANKCYKIISGSYKCLPNKEDFRLTNGERSVVNGKLLEINCALDESKWSLERMQGGSLPASGLTVSLSGVEITPAQTGGMAEIDLCDYSKVPQKSGPLEVYITDGSDKYKAFGATVSFALDKCVSEIGGKLDSYSYSFGEGVTFDKLEEDLTKALKDEIRTVSCSGYSVEISIKRPCELENPSSCLTETTWDKEKYSIITLEFKEEGEGASGETAARASYIITYSP